MPEATAADDLAEGSRALGAVLPDFAAVAGWLNPEEAEELFQAAAAARGGCVVEVGSYRGRSTRILCAGSSIGAKVPVYAVEPHEETVGLLGAKFGPQDRAAFFRNFCHSELVRYVRLLNTTSAVAAAGWDKPVALLFIDGDHRYPAVLADFAAWERHLLRGAAVAFYDADLAGPKKLIEMLLASGTLDTPRRVRKLALLRFTGAPAALSDATVEKAPGVAATFAPAAGDYHVSWRDIGFHLYFGGDGRYLYQPIPKCACTTIKTLLLELEGLPVDADLWRRHQKRYNQFPGTAHLSEQAQRDVFEGRTGTFKFVVVRNPYARLASVYSDKFLLRPDGHWVGQIRRSAAAQGLPLSDAVSFEEFVRVVSAQSIKEMDDHWRPQYYEGRFAMIQYDFVGRMETMPDDLIYALETIGAPDAIIERANERYNVTGSDYDLWEAVSPEVRKLFLATFAIDFDTLHYPRRLPGARRPAL